VCIYAGEVVIRHLGVALEAKNGASQVGDARLALQTVVRFQILVPVGVWLRDVVLFEFLLKLLQHASPVRIDLFACRQFGVVAPSLGGVEGFPGAKDMISDDADCILLGERSDLTPLRAIKGTDFRQTSPKDSY
jgi:hypothetical protein